MSDIKTPASRVHVGRAAPAGRVPARIAPGRAAAGVPIAIDRDLGSRPERRPAADLVSKFIAPPNETAEWIGNPAMPAALAAVSDELAPGGVATTKRNQYVASVVETHLSARRQLSRHLNALLRA